MACEAISQDKWGGKQPIPQRESHRQVPGRLRTLRISCSNSELNRTVARTVHTINESLALHNPIHHQANTTSQPATQLAGCGSLLFSQVSQLSWICDLGASHDQGEISTHYIWMDFQGFMRCWSVNYFKMSIRVSIWELSNMGLIFISIWLADIFTCFTCTTWQRR